MPGEAESEEVVAMPVSEYAPQQVNAPGAAVKERLPENCFGIMLLCEAVLLDPVRGWRMWESTYHRDYDELSEGFQQKLEYLKFNAKEVQEWNKDHINDPDMHLALNNRADVDPDWMLTPNNVGCIPYEEYISELKEKEKESRQAPEICELCGSVKFVPHSRPSQSGGAELQKTTASTVSEDAAQQGVAPEAVKERHSQAYFNEMLLCEAVLLDPVRGWRFWASGYERDYNESSKVFQEKLNNLEAHAKVVKDRNTRFSSNPDKWIGLDNLADSESWSEKSSKLGCLPIKYYILALKHS